MRLLLLSMWCWWLIEIAKLTYVDNTNQHWSSVRIVDLAFGAKVDRAHQDDDDANRDDDSRSTRFFSQWLEDAWHSTVIDTFSKWPVSVVDSLEWFVGMQ